MVEIQSVLGYTWRGITLHLARSRTWVCILKQHRWLSSVSCIHVAKLLSENTNELAQDTQLLHGRFSFVESVYLKDLLSLKWPRKYLCFDDPEFTSAKPTGRYWLSPVGRTLVFPKRNSAWLLRIRVSLCLSPAKVPRICKIDDSWVWDKKVCF